MLLDRQLGDEDGTALSLENAGVAFALVIAAGMCTALGAAAVFVNRLVELASKQVLAVGLAFAAGVMIYVSCMDVFAKSHTAFLEDGFAEADSYTLATLSMFAGMLLMKVIFVLVHVLDPHHEKPLDDTICRGVVPSEHGRNGDEEEDLVRLRHMGLNTALAIALHNMPEGLATFVGYLGDEGVGVALAIGIGFHNIPEGLCVALPIYYATGSRIRGFCWALLSGLSEPVGAAIGWGILQATGDDLRALVYAVLFGLVGGMMIMISIHELLPTAFRYDPKDTVTTTSFVLGMAIMATSLCLLQY